MVQHITRGKWDARQADRLAEVPLQLPVVSSLLQLAVTAEVQFEFLQVSPGLLD
jgi:hypothetical protein